MPKFDIKAVAALVTPPSHRVLNDSAFDPGSPQYVRPEDMMLDLQSSLFGMPRKDKAPRGADPADFRARWLRDGAPSARIERVGTVADSELADATAGLLRCSRRKAEHYPTVLPLLPALGAYKNIRHKLPAYFSDQLRPLITGGGPGDYAGAVEGMCNALRGKSQPDDTLLRIAEALLPLPAQFAALTPASDVLRPYESPMVMEFGAGGARPIAICQSYREVLAAMLEFEAEVPRILWVRWFTAVHRLFLPLFFLRRCTVTSAAARAMRAVLGGGPSPSAGDLSKELLGRGTVLRGSPEMLNQLQPVIQEYVRARIEISVTLQLTCIAESLNDSQHDPKNPANHRRLREEFEEHYMEKGAPRRGIADCGPLAMPADSGPKRLPLDKWLGWLAENRSKLDHISVIIGADSVSDLVDKVFGELRREYMPLANGFGKNAREFVGFTLGAPAKVDRDAAMPDEFNLILRSERGTHSGHIAVRPGSALLVMLVQVAARRAERRFRTSAKLGDICDLFESVGVDFRSEPSDFEFLKGELLRHGLLETSADAAEAASLKPAYAIKIPAPRSG